MEKYNLDHDIKVFYITAKSFPDGIGAAYQKLHALLPNTEGRQFYGISYLDGSIGKGHIIYKAAVEEAYAGEAEKYGCEAFIIKKGTFLSETLMDWRKDEIIVGKTFQNMLSDPHIDENGYCLEVYMGEKDMRCMVPLDSSNS
jgi:hypothetical protein